MQVDELVESFVGLKIPKTHATVGLSNLIAAHKDYRTLFINRRLPDHGWSDVEIQHLLFTLATLDTNNKSLARGGDSSSSSLSNNNATRWCGVGEREGRVFSSLVAARHYGLSHGTGRSGDITEPQPKAVGSSVLVKLCLLLVMDAVRRGSGLTGVQHGILLPLCTGMSMSLVLSSLREQEPSKKIVLWSRIDQKSCFKAVASSGLICVVVPTTLEGDEVVTNMTALQDMLQTQYKDQVLAVITTTSCFAPRVPDQVDLVARVCQETGVAHIVNHAYGLQCAKTNKLLNRAMTVGRVDAVVCSTDKNFLVPVGGALVVSPTPAVCVAVGKLYAGRASSSPMVDLFITLLSMGLQGYRQLLADRQALVVSFTERLTKVAAQHNERLLACTERNTISFAITLDHLVRQRRDDEEDDKAYQKAIASDLTSLGAMLFSRCVSGTRIIPRNVVKIMGGQEFCGFGSSYDRYPHAYMTAACAIGVNPAEVDEFFLRLDKTLKEFKKKIAKQQRQAVQVQQASYEPENQQTPQQQDAKISQSHP